MWMTPSEIMLGQDKSGEKQDVPPGEERDGGEEWGAETLKGSSSRNY